MFVKLSGTDWGWELEELRTVYQTMCRPTLEYCSPAWQPWLSERKIGKLERVQREATRRMTGLLRTTPIEAVATEVNLTSVATQSKRAAIIAWESL